MYAQDVPDTEARKIVDAMNTFAWQIDTISACDAADLARLRDEWKYIVRYRIGKSEEGRTAAFYQALLLRAQVERKAGFSNFASWLAWASAEADKWEERREKLFSKR